MNSTYLSYNPETQLTLVPTKNVNYENGLFHLKILKIAKFLLNNYKKKTI